jgi:hypothetical protein
MKILITSENEFTGAILKIGKYYNVEPADTGTIEQNRCWHSLLQEYWSSGCHSYKAGSFEHFRELIKLYLGAGVEKYRDLVDDNGEPVEKPVVKYRLKSWRDYTKAERTSAIQNLINEMIQAQVQTKKFYEILHGLEQNSMKAAG